MISYIIERIILNLEEKNNSKGLVFLIKTTQNLRKSAKE